MAEAGSIYKFTMEVPIPCGGARDDHGDDGDDHKMIKCST